jgi:hypothetical protein
VTDVDFERVAPVVTVHGGRFLGPHDTPFGLREFVYTDTDGIVHRVGSPLDPT